MSGEPAFWPCIFPAFCFLAPPKTLPTACNQVTRTLCCLSHVSGRSVIKAETLTPRPEKKRNQKRLQSTLHVSVCVCAW